MRPARGIDFYCAVTVRHRRCGQVVEANRGWNGDQVVCDECGVLMRKDVLDRMTDEEIGERFYLEREPDIAPSVALVWEVKDGVRFVRTVPAHEADRYERFNF